MKFKALIWQATSQKWHKVAETRFGQLPTGQHFSWQGKQWQKTSPLIARQEGSDEPRMVPRSALVVVDDNDARSNENIEPGATACADLLQKIQQECLTQIELLHLETAQMASIRSILEQVIGQASASHQERAD